MKLYATTSTANGSGAIVSPDGLVLTCHHCVVSSLADASTAEKDLVASGWLARRWADEIPCESRVADVLIGVENVTEHVRQPGTGYDYESAEGVLAGLVRDRQRAIDDAGVDDEVIIPVALYGGAEHWLYRYRRYTDVRLVFAPEAAVAAFGGDVDNLRYPRWCLDVALVRLYRHGKPASTPEHLRVNFDGARRNDPVFVSGNPMSTERLRTVGELDLRRRLELPRWLLLASELRGRYLQYAASGARAAQAVKVPCLLLENWVKIRRMQLEALLDVSVWDAKLAEERELRAFAAARVDQGVDFGDPFEDMHLMQRVRARLFLEYSLIEAGIEWGGQLVRHARSIVRGATERTRPDAMRQRDFASEHLGRIEKSLTVHTSSDVGFETLQLTFWLEKLLEWLGPRHALVAQHLMAVPLSQFASRVMGSTTLGDASARKALWDGGLPAVEASEDPLVVLLRNFEPSALAVRDRYREEVDRPERKVATRLAALRFAASGRRQPPDATATLRISPGRVEAWSEDGEASSEYTRLGDLFDLATGVAPFALPDSWSQARDRLDLKTPFNVVTSTDITAGNSGSPLIDDQGDVVGVIFDGNQHSMAGAYAFDVNRNRAISVHLGSLRQALEVIYGASELIDELCGASVTGVEDGSTGLDAQR